MEIEEAAKVPKKTIHGPANANHKLHHKKKMTTNATLQESPIQHPCYHRGKSNHQSSDCRHKSFTCNYCKINKHLKILCRKKKYRDNDPLKIMRALNMVNNILQLQLGLKLPNQSLLLDKTSFFRKLEEVRISNSSITKSTFRCPP